MTKTKTMRNKQRQFSLKKNYLGEYEGVNHNGIRIHLFPFRNEHNLPINKWNYSIHFSKGSGLNRLTHDIFPSKEHALHDLNNYIKYWFDHKVKFKLIK